MDTPATPPAYTPGPWFAELVDLIVYDDSEKTGRTVAIVAQREEPTEDSDVTSANARLIAAAPELLEACREAASLLGDIFNALTEYDDGERERYSRVFDLLDAATAKAEGTV